MPSARVWVVLVVLVASLAVAGVIDGGSASGSSPEAVSEENLVEPRENGSHLWPYTSSARSPDERTLAINVVVHGDPTAVRRAMTERTSLEWNRTTENETDATAEAHSVESVEIDDEGVEWGAARGSTRYTYVEPNVTGDRGQWVDESYQLHTGSYLGSRYHVRAYVDPDREWTAMQAHQEYWDWFRLRHTVTGVRSAGLVIESDFIDEPFVEDVRRVYHGHRGGGSDGWVTVVDLALTLALVGALRVRRDDRLDRLRDDSGVLSTRSDLPSVDELRRDLPSPSRLREEFAHGVAEYGREIGLFFGLVLLYLGVRSAGIALERALPGVSPKLFAGALYPILAFGTPLLAARLARPLDSSVAFAVAVAGLGAAIVLDFGALGVVSLPIQLVLHRVALLVSLGLIAAGEARHGTEEGRSVTTLGVVGWAACLLLPLLGVL
ncbi:hypothetical protein [Halegenticoccus tardaugens]|uniref:hypothetical protein n=1 Tax=Halegenticoccus tardaugens TaxID=2071624 RepID=UPI0013E8F7D8|nr:hypothetical protein [Halegenticoccus tardaugens]